MNKRLLILIVVLLVHDRVLLGRGHDERVDDDHLAGTVVRHFRLASPIAQLPSGMPSAASRAPLVPRVARSPRLSSLLLRTLAPTVDVAAVAVAADHRQRVAPTAVELPGAGLW